MTKLISSALLLLLAFGIQLSPYAQEPQVETKEVVRELLNKEVLCLAKNIYYEAASEPYEGKLAVAQITLNRTNDPRYPKDICGVVYQKTVANGKITCQFTWTCFKEYAIRSKYLWEESLLVARRALTESVLHDKIAQTNALHYHAVYVDPKWSKGKIVARIGNHIFYL